MLTTTTKKIKDGLQGISKAEISLTGLKLEFQNKDNKDWDWKMAGEILLGTLDKLENKVLIVLDEFGYFLSRMQDEELLAFLQWLRSIRHNSTVSKSVRWLVSSEIHLDYHLKRLNTRYAFEDFHHITLAPFNYKTADDFLYSLIVSEGYNSNREQRKFILDKIGTTYPFYIQIFVQQLIYAIGDTNKEITEELINEVFDGIIQDSSRSLFPWLTQIIQGQFKSDVSKYAEAILIELSNSEAGMDIDEIQNIFKDDSAAPCESINMIVDLLRRDFILSSTDGKLLLDNSFIKAYYSKAS